MPLPISPRTETSNPHAARRPFRPGLRERLLRRSGAYRLLHGLHLPRQEELRRVAALMERGGRLLDLACGDGYYTRRFSDLLGCDTRGVDLMPSRIARAEYYNAAPRCRFDLGDAARLPYADAEFDQIVSLCALEHFPDDGPVLAEAYRVLRPGGKLVVSCDAFYRTGISEGALRVHAERHYVLRFYTAASLRAALERAGFRVDRIVPVFAHPASILLFRGAMRLRFDWSNPFYNVYSLAAAPVVERLERRSSSSAEIVRAVFLVARAQRPGSPGGAA